MDTAQLIERCRQGDRDALALLYTTYAKRMKSVCRRYFSDTGTVNDVLHDAFVVILTSLDKLRDTSKAEPWMMSIVRNVASKAKTRFKATIDVSLDDAAAIVDDGDSETIDIPNISKLMCSLPEGYRTVLRLSVFEGMTHKQIAETLGIEPHTSSSQLSRAKKMLRQMIRKSWILLLLLIGGVALQKFFDHHKPTVATIPDAIIPPSAVSADTNNNAQIPTVKIPTGQDSAFVSVEEIIADTTTPTIDIDTLIMVSDIDTTITVSDTLIAVNDTADCNIEIWTPGPNAEKPKRRGKWSVKLSYAGTSDKTSNYDQPYSFSPALPSSRGEIQSSPVVGPTVPSTPSTPSVIDNWNDYAVYVANNPDLVSSKAGLAIMRIALNNANAPGTDKMLRTSIHHAPMTWALTLRYKSAGRFGFETGLGYTRAVSDFEIGSDGNVIKERQTVNYIGIPLKGIFNICDTKHLNLYFGLMASTEIPSGTSLRSDYYISGEFEASERTTIKAPWQWSSGCGFGIQYNITPRIGLIAEPSLRYYFQRSGVETFCTEHPMQFAVPVGLRFSW